MRFTSVLKKLLGVTQLYVRGLVMDRDDALSIEVTPTWRTPRCAGCGRRAPQYDHPRSIGRWQDLNWGPVRVYLVYRCRRVTCARCGGGPRTERVPNATIIFDRFHVQQLSTNAVDAVRRDQQRALRTAGDPDEATVTKGTRFALLKNPWNLTLEQGRKLSAVLRNNVQLFRAYLLNQTLAGALDYRQPKRARRPSMTGSRGRAVPSSRLLSRSREPSGPRRRGCSPIFGSA